MTDRRSTTDTGAGTPESARLNWARTGLGIVGFLVVAAAFTTASDRLTGIVSMLREAADADYLLIMAFGGVAVGLAALVFVAARGSVHTIEPPEVERPTPAPEPGEPFEERLDDWHHWLPIVARQSREAVRTRLRRTAIRVVEADLNVSETEAATVVTAGSWTSDDVAARYLGDGGDRAGPRIWLAALAHGETPVRYRARRAMRAIVAVHNNVEEDGE